MALVNAYIARVVMDERHDRQSVCIKACEGDEQLIMVIGQHEAMAIERALHREGFPRPLTHDLLLDCLAGLETRLVGVSILREEAGTYFADLRIARPDGAELLVDCRPSDGLALLARSEQAVLQVDDSLFDDED